MTVTVYGKKTLAILFLLLLSASWFISYSYTMFGEICGYLRQQAAGVSVEAAAMPDQESFVTMESLETKYAASLKQQPMLIELNGIMAKKLKMQGYYGGIGIYVTGDGYIVTAYGPASTDYEYEEIMSFKNYLDEKGIHLIYVNKPIKYLDDDLFRDAFGIESYGNRNADLLLRRIAGAGVDVIDLRDKILEDGLDIYDMFYRTDHHWKTWSGLWAAGKIAAGLNECCGYDIDLSLYDESRYTFTDWEACWLGEQGRVVGASYVGLDDYSEIKPGFETDISFKMLEGFRHGSFDDYIDESMYDLELDVYEAPSWHYSYAMTDVVNHDASYGKILVPEDSCDHVPVPFLSLGVSEVNVLALRHFEGSLRDYIAAGDYDTVLICYTEFMIGAHDDPQSANYRMFTFE